LIIAFDGLFKDYLFVKMNTPSQDGLEFHALRASVKRFQQVCKLLHFPLVWIEGDFILRWERKNRRQIWPTPWLMGHPDDDAESACESAARVAFAVGADSKVRIRNSYGILRSIEDAA
jgi:hypothetical protein